MGEIIAELAKRVCGVGVVGSVRTAMLTDMEVVIELVGHSEVTNGFCGKLSTVKACWRVDLL